METLFFDNNIPIRYCFLYDPQHQKAKEALESNSIMYWSKNVEHEFQKVFNKKILILEEFIDDIKIQLDEIKENIDKNKLINIMYCLKNEHFKRNSILIIVEDMWKLAQLKSNVSTNEIQKYLNDYKRKFKKITTKSKSSCYNIFNTRERKKLYPDKEKFLKNCVDGEDSLIKLGNDRNIVLDAHDLSYKSNIQKLTFVTDDIQLFKCKELIEIRTKIYNIFSFRDYNFK
jgi:predicted nucleic acid-binding protein